MFECMIIMIDYKEEEEEEKIYIFCILHYVIRSIEYYHFRTVFCIEKSFNKKEKNSNDIKDKMLL